MKGKVKNFKQFESNKDILSEDDIRDIFSELLDQDYEAEFFDTSSNYSYYFQLKKKLNESDFDPIDIGSAYGITNLKKIEEVQSEFISIMEGVKSRIDRLNHHIGFEFEFHFGSYSMIFVSCHMQNKNYSPKDSINFGF